MDDEQHPRLREFMSEIMSREMQILRAEIEGVRIRQQGDLSYILEKIAAVKETAGALLPETQRRLEELNNAAARRSEQEKMDRLAYVQASEYQTWKTGVEKELKALTSIIDRISGEKMAKAWLPIVATGILTGVVMLVIQRLWHA